MDTVTRFLGRRDLMVARLDEQLHEASSAHDAAWILCEYTGRELNLADCVVYLPAPDEILVPVAAWGSRRNADRMLESRLRLPLGRGIVGECALLLQTRRVDDARDDGRYIGDDQPGLSELAVPVSQDGVLLGVLDSEDAGAAFYDTRYVLAFEAIARCGAAHLWRLHGAARR